MSLYRRAARRDENEAGIVEALKRAGASVQPLSAKDVPDLLVGFRGQDYKLEIKRPDETKGGKSQAKRLALREGQREWVDRWQGSPTYVVRDPQEALAVLLRGPKPGCLLPEMEP